MVRQIFDLFLKVELSLWDTAGQERFHSLGPIYYRDAAAALIVFDITDIDSFERAKAWVKELYQMVSFLSLSSPICNFRTENEAISIVLLSPYNYIIGLLL